MLSLDDFAHNTAAAQSTCESAEVIVVQRNLLGPVLSAIQHWKAVIRSSATLTTPTT
jgi:hypothetical protein